MIIYLNGASSTGKSSIIKHIKELSEKPIVHWSVDAFGELLDDKFGGDGELAHLGCKFIQSKDDKGFFVRIEKGDLGKKIDKMMLETIDNFAKNGFDIVVDDVLEYDCELEPVKEKLSQYGIFFIKTICSVEILNQREISRGDRMLGIARGTMENIDKMKFKYDLSIDTSSNSPLEIARKIINFVGL